MLLRTSLRGLARDTRGVAAVEFALVAPVLILVYFALAQLCQGYMAYKRTGHVAAMVADLVTQNNTLDQTGAANVFGIGEQIMQPFPTSRLKQRVTSVTRVSSTKLTVDWSLGSGLGPMPASEASVPAGVIQDGQTVIIAESEYQYVSSIGDLIPSSTFKRKTYLMPRNVPKVICTAKGC